MGDKCGYSKVGNLRVKGIQHLKASPSSRKRWGSRRDVERWGVTREAGDSLKDPGRGEKQARMQQLIIFNINFLWQAFILMDSKIFEKTEYAVVGCLIFPARWPSSWWVSVTWRKSQKLQLWAGEWKQRPEGPGVCGWAGSSGAVLCTWANSGHWNDC